MSIDGEHVGTIPLAGPLTTLSPGEHTIKVEKPGFAPYIDVFKIDRKKPTRVDVELVAVAGVLKLKANVEAARVYVDGKFVGEAPITTGAGGRRARRAGVEGRLQGLLPERLVGGGAGGQPRRRARGAARRRQPVQAAAAAAAQVVREVVGVDGRPPSASAWW